MNYVFLHLLEAPPRSLKDLLMFWSQIPPHIFSGLEESIPQWVRAVIVALERTYRIFGRLFFECYAYLVFFFLLGCFTVIAHVVPKRLCLYTCLTECQCSQLKQSNLPCTHMRSLIISEA